MPSPTPQGTQPGLGILPAYVNQGLFSDHHLEHRIQETEPWKVWTLENCGKAHAHLADSLAAYEKVRQPKNEEDTRQWLDKVLGILGAAYHREKTSATGRPDYVLFESPEHQAAAAKALAAHQPEAYYPHALTVLEAKYWDRALQASAGEGDRENPVMQINRYLDDVAIHSGNAIQWAILTNGRLWRLYWRGASSRALTHYEVDLPELLANPHQEPGDFIRLRYFLAFFGPQAFMRDGRGCCNLDRIREASERYALEVGDSLERAIYGDQGAFLTLAKGLYLDATVGGQKALEDSPLQDLRSLETATLVLLFRLLFLLYAEDRRLLPMERKEYREASLTALRDAVAEAVDRGKVPTTRQAKHWGHLETLFDLVNEGDAAMGLPYYNGGLFDPERHPLLSRHKVPDAQLIPALDALSRVEMKDHRLRVDFRDLGVRQLGSLYEGLLEYRLRLEGGELTVAQDSLERRVTASYYTHETLVARLVADTLDPILRAREQASEAHLDAWVQAQGRPAKTDGERLARKRQLEEQEAAIESVFFDLRVVDPAMGSGHFLVEALDHLTDGLVAILGRHQERPELKETLHPVLQALQAQREAIGASLTEQGLAPDAVDAILPHLDDLRLLKRAVMKRCLFGVDLNPMAVELAKLSLWLDSFTLGAPLSFLDHHLKTGNSLVGATLADYRALRQDRLGAIAGAGLFAEDEAFDPEVVVGELHQLVVLSDASRDQVRQSRDLHAKVELELARGRTLLDIVTSRGFSNQPRRVGSGRTRALVDEAAQLLADNRAVDRLTTLIREGKEDVSRFQESLRLAALNVLEDRARHHFFHWDLAFPEVFLGHGDTGFDAILTNPPWERIKLQENEFFGQHRPGIAQLQTAAQRKAAIRKLQASDPELWGIYEAAKAVREQLLDYAHDSGVYPLLGRGDTNLYALMVERGLSLLKPEGRSGFVVPSGLSTDHSNSAFFGRMVLDRRLAFLYDFENREGLFPSVDSRFKFSLIGFTGPGGGAAKVPAAFFLHQVDQLEARRLELEPRDFTLMNPNTKTCPVFRTERDYALTKRIYNRVPVLCRHEPPQDHWGSSYKRLFDMTNDSGLFKTAAQLDQLGAYRVSGPIPTWKLGQEVYVPLMEGKMVQSYDPRAAGVRVNLANLHRPAVPAETTLSEWCDPAFFPTPQYWIPSSEIGPRVGGSNSIGFIGFKSVTSPTNFRTMIAAWLPCCGVGNSMPIMLSTQSPLTQLALLANLNAAVYDFVLRRKIGGQNLNFFYIEQQPTLPPAFYDGLLHGRSWASLIAPRALELSYTCEALRPMAVACGHTGDPYPWDPARRRHLQAQLDALFFLAYSFDAKADEDEVAYILSTFPILCEQDPGYPALVRSYLRAYRTGDLDARVAG